MTPNLAIIRVRRLKLLAHVILLIFLFTGCSNQAALETQKKMPSTKGQEMKNASFTINGTEFGIDLSKSSFSVVMNDASTGFENEGELTIEIYGNEETFKQINADYDASDWSWASYPPHFYIREYYVEKVAGSTTIVANAESYAGNYSGYEHAIYMMEHSDVYDNKVELDPDNNVKVTGRVDLFGEIYDFKIQWEK